MTSDSNSGGAGSSQDLVSECRLRSGGCLFRGFCHNQRSDTYGFYPKMKTVDKGECLWSSNSAGHYVLILESGLMVSVALISPDGDEFPYGIFSKGYVVGLVELEQGIEEVSTGYMLKALTPARVCMIPQSAVLQLFSQHQRMYKEVMSYAMTNIATAAAAMCLILSRKRVYDKVETFLNVLDEILSRDEDLRHTLKLTHEDIAFLVASDRVSVTRALAKMQEDGVVNYGYRRITHFVDEPKTANEMILKYFDME